MTKKSKELEGMKEVCELRITLETEMIRAWQKQSLLILGLNVGDVVFCKFKGGYINGKNSYSRYYIQEGVIKQGDDLSIHIQSLKPVQQTFNMTNSRTGRDNRNWWAVKNLITKAGITSIVEIDES